MNKVARKPSSDPVQEKLRQNKAVWNKEVSTFINDLINLKRTMNGWPSKFHMERSSIKDPIPADPNTILGVLAGDFQELAQKGNAIIEEQLAYTQTRKKKQPKSPGSPSPASTITPPTPSEPNLSQQLSAVSAEYELLSLGSNPLSRFVSTLKGPWFGSSPEARSRKYRVSMLKSAADLNRDFKRFESQIVGSTPQSIFAGGKILQKIENQLFYIQESLTSHKIKLEEQPVATEKGKENVSKNEAPVAPTEPVVVPDDPVLLEMKNAISDFRKSQLNFTNLNPALERAFASAMLKFYNSPNDAEKVKLAPLLMKAYQDLLSDTNMKHGTNAATLHEILMPKTASEQLQSVAQNMISKWFGQLKHKLSPFDKTSALRLDLMKLSENSRKILDYIMDSLESDIDFNTVTYNINIIDKNVIEMKQKMKPLESLIKGNMFDSTFLNMLKNKKLTEYSPGLNQNQETHLQRMIQNKQFRELTNNIYNRK